MFKKFKKIVSSVCAMVMLIICFSNFKCIAISPDMMNVYAFTNGSCYMATIPVSHYPAWENQGWSKSFPLTNQLLYWEEKSSVGNNKVMRAGQVIWYEDSLWEYVYPDHRDEVKLLYAIKFHPWVYYHKNQSMVLIMDEEAQGMVDTRNVYVTTNWRELVGPKANGGDYIVAFSERIDYDMSEASVPYVRATRLIAERTQPGEYNDIYYGFTNYWGRDLNMVAFKDNKVTFTLYPR